MTLLDNYKPREKKDFKYKCLGCITLKKIIKKYEELKVNMNKHKLLLEERKTLQIEMKNTQKRLIILLENENDMLQELNKLMIEQENSENQENYDEKDEKDEKINEKYRKYIENEKDKDKEKMIIEELNIKIDDNTNDEDVLYDEIIEDEKMIKKYLEKFNSLEMIKC